MGNGRREYYLHPKTKGTPAYQLDTYLLIASTDFAIERASSRYIRASAHYSPGLPKQASTTCKVTKNRLGRAPRCSISLSYYTHRDVNPSDI